MTDNPHYVTPDEAEKMGCPMSMARQEFAASCINKECLAWRWKQQYDLSGKVVKKISTTHGYCGMVRA
jgi:ribosomal protein L35AE/L33A